MNGFGIVRKPVARRAVIGHADSLIGQREGVGVVRKIFPVFDLKLRRDLDPVHFREEERRKVRFLTVLGFHGESHGEFAVFGFAVPHFGHAGIGERLVLVFHVAQPDFDPFAVVLFFHRAGDGHRVFVRRAGKGAGVVVMRRFPLEAHTVNFHRAAVRFGEDEFQPAEIAFGFRAFGQVEVVIFGAGMRGKRKGHTLIFVVRPLVFGHKVHLNGRSRGVIFDPRHDGISHVQKGRIHSAAHGFDFRRNKRRVFPFQGHHERVVKRKIGVFRTECGNAAFVLKGKVHVPVQRAGNFAFSHFDILRAEMNVGTVQIQSAVFEIVFFGGESGAKQRFSFPVYGVNAKA